MPPGGKGRGKGRGKRSGKAGPSGGGGPIGSGPDVPEAGGVDPAKAKQLLWSWLQKSQKTKRPADLVSLEPAKARRGHTCTAWVWINDDWAGYEAPGSYSSRQEATLAAYVAAVEGLEVPVPKDCLLTEEARAKLRARGAEQSKQQQALELRQKAVAEASRELEAEILRALFPTDGSSNDGFRTPREREDEPMPEPQPARLLLPPPLEARGGEERGNKSTNQLKQLAKREPQMVQGPTTYETQRAAPGGAVHVCACAMVFDRSVAVIGIACGAKKASVRAAAASEALARLDVSAALPSRDEAGPHAAHVVELRRLHALQPFKVWALQGVQPGDKLRWYCALWGSVPFQGGLRDFWGEGAADDRALAIAGACAEARGQLTRLLGGSGDCSQWLRSMARVTMEVEDVSMQTVKCLVEAETDTSTADYELKLRRWLQQRKARSGPAAEPPDLAAGPAPTAPQLYEPESEASVRDDKKKAERGLPKLPVRELRGQLAEALGDSSCLVVSGGTGSGKSTQIPQYLVDDFRPEGLGGPTDAASPKGDSGARWAEAPSSAASTADGTASEGPLSWARSARVVVTEPRRIAAIALAERVAFERGEPVGRSVGYSVRGDSSPPNRGLRGGTMEFCTVGILLRRLQRDPLLKEVSHVLVDEVHERDLMTDFLLILLKELLCVRSDLRVVLMSATLDVHTFTGYFWGCPCLEIPTGPRYEVQEVHLEDAELGGARWAGGLPAHLLAKEAEARQAADRAAQEADEEAQGDGEGDGPDEPTFGPSTGVWWGSSENDETYIELMVRLVLNLAEGPALVDDDGVPGSVLCFLPGWAEIKSAADRLQEMDHKSLLWVLPLHSTLPKNEQQLIFQRPEKGKTKVILGTNIAESSVTIDDVLVVVDSGLMREVAYDPVRRLSTLETVWVSQSSAIQRKGRAGRVRKGRCFRMYSREQLEQAPWRTTPELQRCELTSTCLQALALKREARDFLGRAPDAPTRAAVETALEELQRLGAVCLPDEEDDEPRGPGAMREQMMPLGDALSHMTVSPTLGRMLVMGTLFGATDEACLLAAVVAAPRRIFVCPPGKKKESLACVRGFCPTSDTLAAYAACKDFEGWKAARSEGFCDRWAGDLFLVPKRLKQLLQASAMHREELQRAGLVARKGASWDAGGSWSWSEGAGWSWESAEEYREVWDEVNCPDVVEEETGEPMGDPTMELVKALLVAAYPQNLALRRRINMAKHNTATGLDAIITPQSVNAPPKAKASTAGAPTGGDRREPSWWSYGSMQISNRQGFLRATTLIDPYHVALFGGLHHEQDQHGALREVDGWIELRGQRSTLRVLARLRDAMSRCIHLKALEPGRGLPEGQRTVLRELATLLKAAAPRQARIASLLPEAPTAEVEKPPPPSERPKGAREKGGREKGGGKARGKGDTSWSQDGGAGGWDSWQGGSSGSRGGAAGSDKGRGRSKGGRGGWDASGWDGWGSAGGWDAGGGWDSSGGWGAEGWSEPWPGDAAPSQGHDAPVAAAPPPGYGSGEPVGWTGGDFVPKAQQQQRPIGTAEGRGEAGDAGGGGRWVPKR